MSAKDLFNKGYSLKTLKNKSQSDLREDLESQRFVEAHNVRRHRYFPDVNFATASNFARFGLAEEYYDVAIKRIYQTYPYDGSLAEKIEWENESTYLDLFIFENEYPRTNGFVIFNSSSHTYLADNTNSIYTSSAPQYISFFGGPHADPGGDYKSDFSAGPSKKGISKANIYDTGSQRTNNLELDLAKGVTVEFWMKKDGWAHTSVDKDEYIFHNISAGSTGADYGSFRIRTRGKTDQDHQIQLLIESGSTSMTFFHDTGFSAGSQGLADSKWHHYAVTAKTSGTDTISNLYVDGRHQSKIIESSTTIGPVEGVMYGAIGALAASVSSSAHQVHAAAGWGNIVSCSFDEFRYWKTERDAQQIGRYYRDQVGGGTNTDNVKYDDITNKVQLGVYYKFNEGITGNSTTDATILDYSGRVSNGSFNNYQSTSRNIGSAIVQSEAAVREFKDPILYENHPDVSSYISDKKTHAIMYDNTNNFSLYKTLPGWMLEEDEKKSNHLKYLLQILGSFFDDLYLQIQKLSKLKDINYPDDNNFEKPLPFAERLLETRGYDAPELFAHASSLAKYLERDERKLFEKKLYEVKNIIYQNVYNNLSYIQKSKGTFKSLRNFLRCFGVDEELVKLNIYANSDVYEFKDNFTNTALKKRFIDFDDAETRLSSSANHAQSFTANAYQFKNSSQDNSISYIPGISATHVSGAALTVQAEIIFPKRTLMNDPNYQLFPDLTSSIFGLHAVNASDTDLSFASDNTINFSVVASKNVNDKRDASIVLKTIGGSDILTSVSTRKYIGLYDNQKWNIAFRLKPSGYPNPAAVKDTFQTYTYELYGNSHISDTIHEEFNVTGTIPLASAAKFFTEPKRIFAGSNRTNFTGSVINYSDVKVSSVRAWYSYLDDETMRAHGRDSSNYGAIHPFKNSNLTDTVNVLGTKIPQIKTLVLNWSLDNVTGSDSNGRFYIDDFSSGSAGTTNYGPLTAILEKNYTGRGDFFVSDPAFRGEAVDVEFVQTARQKLPEVVNSDDMVKILNKQDDVVFTRDTTYVQHLLSVEKSMYQTISEEMLRFFASVADFNNLVGEPVNRYRPYYKKLEKARQLFFDRVEENPDLDKYINFYRWIDDAVTIMISQLIPASSNKVELLRNMVESHVLERNKYWTKFPTIETQSPSLAPSLRGIEELKYNWKFGHAPVGANQNTNQNNNCLWWKQRADRAGVLSSGVSSVDTDKDKILKITVTELSGTTPMLKTAAGTKYASSYYANRSLSRVALLDSDLPLNLKSGANPGEQKIHDYYKSVIKWGSDDDFIFIDMDNEIKQKDCDDEVIPPELNKKKLLVKTLTMPADVLNESDALGAGENDQQYNDAKSDLILPFSMYSSSISSDYRSLYIDQFGLDFTNLHDDKYGIEGEIPLQGPFTKQHVGGMAHRHIKLNQGSDNRMTRPEGWHLESFLNLSTGLEYLLNESFDGASGVATTDINILSLPPGSQSPEPSPHEYWSNGVNADNSWTFFEGSTPSAGTGPSSGKYAYCEVLPSKVGQTFSLVTPLIDLLEVDSGSRVDIRFGYHMHGAHIGNLKVQTCRYKNFSRGVKDLLVDWGAFNSTVISGQQHSSPTDAFTTAIISTESSFGSGLTDYLGKRFYIRFLYTAGPGHLGDIAIDAINIYKHGTAGVNQNSFKLFHPTYDDVRRPYATLTRDNLAKSPVNIKNIHMTGNSPTIAGNYLNRYEYVSTNSPEANDPYFVKNNSNITAIHPEIPLIQKIEDLLNTIPGAPRKALPTYRNFTLPDRSFLTGSIKNKTRIMTRFSSPGGYETTSRGFLDPAHETYSVYNVMTFRNLSSRTIHNTQLQAHQGRFGVSTHGAGPQTHLVGSGSARVFGSEATGSINKLDYTLVGDPARHKYHRNNIERYKVSVPSQDFDGATVVLDSDFDNGFVSHMIPRLDNQMRWITASII